MLKMVLHNCGNPLNPTSPRGHSLSSPTCLLTIHTGKPARTSARSKKHYKGQVSYHREINDLVTPRICMNLNLVTVFLEPPDKTKISDQNLQELDGKDRGLRPRRRAPEYDGPICRPAAFSHRGLKRTTVRASRFPHQKREGVVEWEIGAYKLEEGGVLQMGVGVQRSLQQHPPGARESRRGGATASHTYRRLLTCRVRAVSLCGDITSLDASFGWRQL
jgi:hypothetical protein